MCGEVTFVRGLSRSAILYAWGRAIRASFLFLICGYTPLFQSAPVEVETMPGVRCRRVTRPIGAVGVYVPGGTAVLPSSALMLAVPAKIAGCVTIVLATPPRPDGTVTPEVLYCAKKAGVTHILKAGGAQVWICGGGEGACVGNRREVIVLQKVGPGPESHSMPPAAYRPLLPWPGALPAVPRLTRSSVQAIST